MDRWEKLSHGERKRCQIATALFLNPSVLAIDEPSNHLDSASKEILLNALARYRGIGILVSHDRQLLDNLCHHTLFVRAEVMDLRSCNYSTAALELEKETHAQQHDYEVAKREVKKLKRQVVKQKEKAGQADKMRSKRGLDPRDHDAKSKIDGARLTGKDAVAGRLYKRVQNQLERRQQKQAEIGFTKSRNLGISFNEQKARMRFPITIQPDTLSLSQEKALRIPDLLIQYGDKIGIICNNGTGKSSFINYLLNRLNIPAGEIIYIPQEIPQERSKSVISRVWEYDNEKKGYIMTLISPLGSKAVHVLETTIPSPGEIRMLLLAEGIMLNPSLIIMDEPTNHLDLPSMQCVEQALNECSCTRLLVSHDLAFLRILLISTGPLSPSRMVVTASVYTICEQI